MAKKKRKSGVNSKVVWGLVILVLILLLLLNFTGYDEEEGGLAVVNPLSEIYNILIIGGQGSGVFIECTIETELVDCIDGDDETLDICVDGLCEHVYEPSLLDKGGSFGPTEQELIDELGIGR